MHTHPLARHHGFTYRLGGLFLVLAGVFGMLTVLIGTDSASALTLIADGAIIAAGGYLFVKGIQRLS